MAGGATPGAQPKPTVSLAPTERPKVSPGMPWMQQAVAPEPAPTTEPAKVTVPKPRAGQVERHWLPAAAVHRVSPQAVRTATPEADPGPSHPAFTISSSPLELETAEPSLEHTLMQRLRRNVREPAETQPTETQFGGGGDEEKTAQPAPVVLHPSTVEAELSSHGYGSTRATACSTDHDRNGRALLGPAVWTVCGCDVQNGRWDAP